MATPSANPSRGAEGAAVPSSLGGGGWSVSTGTCGVAAAGPRLTPEEFARSYVESSRVLWCAAAAIVHDPTQAQDLVQQAAVVGLENLSDFQPGTSFVAWMVRIVKNLSLNEARLRARRRTRDSDPADLDVARSAPPGRAALSTGAINDMGQPREGQMAFDDAVMDALGKLEETARACLLMRVVLDLPYRSIALALDIPEGTAASHVHRARSAMRSSLSPKGGGS